MNYSYQVRSHIFVYCKGPVYCLMKVMKAACRPCCLVPIHRCSAPSVVDCVRHVRVSPRPPSLQPANCSNNLHTSALFQINSATMAADQLCGCGTIWWKTHWCQHLHIRQWGGGGLDPIGARVASYSDGGLLLVGGEDSAGLWLVDISGLRTPDTSSRTRQSG